MTVIRKGQNNYEFPTVSNNNSDTESLHLASTATTDTESLHNENIPPTSFFQTRYRPPRPFKIEESLIFHKNGGKRKLRRYQNRTILQTLNEDDETPIFDVFESTESPLTKLLQNAMALECWNQFIEKSEEEQKKIIEDLETRGKIDTPKTDKKPFLRISSKIRRTLKIRRNLSVETVKCFEDDITGFFNRSPQEKCVRYPQSSFDRLLTHAVAQYHCLYSVSNRENEKLMVEIQNLQSEWTPAECFLYELITKFRS